MSKKILMILPLLFLPSIALAQSAVASRDGSGGRGPGGGTDLYRVLREVEAMQRGGRWEKLLVAHAAGWPTLEQPRRTSKLVEARLC
jgi:hypothetical protein